MGDLEMSLDDIIKKKLKKTDLKRNRNNMANVKKPIRRISDPNNRITKNSPGSLLTKKLRTPMNKNVRAQGGASGAVSDARNKIVQNQRQKMTDAREKLGQIAKQTDARLRLIKMRVQRGVGGSVVPSSGMRSAQMMRPIPERSILQRTVQPRLTNPPLYDEEMMDYTNDVCYLNRHHPERVILDAVNYQRVRQDPSVLFRTVENDLIPTRLYEQEKSYNWLKPTLSGGDDYCDIPSSRMSSRILKGVSRGDKMRSSTPNWDMDDTPIVITKKIKPQETVGILKRMSDANLYDGQAVKIIKESSPLSKPKGPTRTLSERFCQEGNQSAQKMTLLKAKLEASQKNGKGGQGEIQAPMGTRIVVSNLVPSVTHEDVKELFEDIGELISSKVVRPGTAEVVYKLHKDAVRAVDVYHNRQLDGQPMKCLLVNNRSTLASNSLRGNERKLGRSVVEVDMTAFRKALHKKSTS